MDASQYEFLAVRLVEIDVGFYKSEGTRYLVHDAVDKLIEIEKRADSLRGLLQPEQIFHQVRGG